MWINHLKITLRRMAKNKGYTFINIAGLTVGIAVCLLIFLWVNDELSFDRFHAKADRTYRALWEARYGENEWKTPAVPMPLGRTLESEFPEVETVTQFVAGGYTFKKGNEYFREQNGAFVDEHFFDVFTMETLSGDPKAGLQQPDAIVLTEAMAQRYFGADNPVGKTIERNDGQLLQVAGVVKAFPPQSHLKIDFLVSSNVLSFLEMRREQWGSASVLTYFTMVPGASVDELQQKLGAYVNEYVVDDEFRQGNNYTSFPFQALTDIHLGPALEMDAAHGGGMTYVWIFSIVAVFILLLACINFINLTTARSVLRAEEVAVRKVLGSQRRQLIAQFFTESIMYVGTSLVLALVLTRAVLPLFNDFADKQLTLQILLQPILLTSVLGFAALTTFITGIIPATVLSSFTPARILKDKIASLKGRNWLREGLVVMQFAISVALIIGTLIIKDQLAFLQDRNLGFDQERVVVIDRATALRNNYFPFVEQLRNMPEVEAVTSAQAMPGDDYDSTIFVPEQPSNYESSSLVYSFVDFRFPDAMDIKVVAGRSFNPDMATDTAACIINQAAAAKLGWEDPIGKVLSYGGFDDRRIVGVVEDFSFRSLHYEVEPIVLLTTRKPLSNMAIRLKPGRVEDQLAKLQATWKEYAPQAPMEFTFLDQDFQQLYEKEMRMGQVFGIFSLLAVFIACLGLFGLAAFLTEQRTKEIGIRKILGATTAGLVGLLSRDFLRLVLIALLIASPVAWYLMNGWLEDFAYRIHIQWWVFAIAGILAVGIAFLTVSFQSVKAAMANPVESLRSE